MLERAKPKWQKMEDKVIHAKGASHLTTLLSSTAGARLVVIDWFAPWCGPCVRIAPFFKQLSVKYPDVLFISVDTEAPQNKMENIHASFDIRAFPTFTFHLKGNEIERFSGANNNKLESTILSLISRAESEQVAEAIRLSMQLSPSEESGKSTSDSAKDTKNEEEALMEGLAKEDEKDPEPTDGKSFNVKVKRITGNVMNISINENAKVDHLKRKVARELKTGVASVRLIFKGKILKDGGALKSYGINADDLTVHVAVSGGGASGTSSGASPSSSSSAAAPAPAPSQPPATAGARKVRDALNELEAKNSKQNAKDAVQVMLLYVRNVVTHPNDMKYRSIRMGNTKFASKVGSCEGGVACMKALGFETQQRDGEAYLVLQSSVSAADMAAFRDELTIASNRLVSPVPAAPTSTMPMTPPPRVPSASGANPFAPFTQSGNNFASMFGGGGQGMGGFGGLPPGVNPEMLEALQNNPQLQAMSNTMMQRLMQDPQLMSSLTQAIASGQDPMTAMMSNPSLMQSMMEMMSDPSIRGNLQGMGMGGFPMFGSQGFGGAPSSFGNSNNNNGNTSNNSNNNNSSNGNSTSNSSNNNNSNDGNGNADNEDDLDDLDDIYQS